ncbi:tryptophan-rich sensory protein [Paraeggerthella hongkongensis]|mgnify:FL=1|uniref:Tryptophan-rich sensory protein n=1 Tax=Paraeggerthella hongkongensis TaxID=230658 RepID=A0A3N0BEK5_9ACTN|nr:tryptophan-rich sensory protein [Paraeggerthella hongkongensis]RNL45718.1 tryptophan-rich sensory protein [Paraeggerthella hongkongensis]
MSGHAHRASTVPDAVQRAHMAQPERARERSRGYFTLEVVVMWVAYVLMIAGNVAIEAGRLGGVTSATVAYGVFTWFTPAGYVFSIWSLIYVALIVWLVSYTKGAPSRPRRFTPVAGLFVASSILNVLWLAVWHFQMIVPAFVVILLDWLVLAALYLNVRTGASSALGWVPISLYTAWITVATLSNMAILITRALDGGMLLLNGASVVALAAGVVSLGIFMWRRFDDIVFQLVFVWALVGVGVHVLDVSLAVAVVVWVLSVLGAVLTLVPFGRSRSASRR